MNYVMEDENDNFNEIIEFDSEFFEQDIETNPSGTIEDTILCEITPDEITDDSNCIPKSSQQIQETDNELITYNIKQVYICNENECEKMYSNMTNLRNHLRSHSGEKPYICKLCNASFNRSYSLKVHSRIHTGEKPYKCTFDCSKSFNTSGDLQKHIRTHTGNRPFKCNYNGCSMSFATSTNLKNHIRTHTGERPYKCNFNGCTKSFHALTNIRNHERIHSGEKPYKCEICEKCFTEYSSLFKHKNLHTKKRENLICTNCNKVFRKISTLEKHIAEIHSAEISEYFCTKY